MLLSNTHIIDTGVATHLLRDVDNHTDKECSKHDSIYGITQFFTSDIKPKCKSHCHRNNKNRTAFKNIRQVCRVFKRVRRIDSEVTTTIRSQLFDRNNSCRRSLRNHLGLSFKGRNLHFTVKSHRSAFCYKYDTYDKRQRHENTSTAQYKEFPKVSYRFRSFGSEGFHDTSHSRHTGSSGNELEKHDNKQLGEISQTTFTTIVLQVTVNHETNTRVERQIWTLSAVPIRIQRKISLRYQQDHTPEEPKYVYNKQRFQEYLPIHLFIGVDTRQLVNKSFNWSHETHAVVSLLIHLGDMLSQRVTDNQLQQYLQCYT